MMLQLVMNAADSSHSLCESEPPRGEVCEIACSAAQADPDGELPVRAFAGVGDIHSFIAKTDGAYLCDVDGENLYRVRTRFWGCERFRHNDQSDHCYQ